MSQGGNFEIVQHHEIHLGSKNPNDTSEENENVLTEVLPSEEQSHFFTSLNQNQNDMHRHRHHHHHVMPLTSGQKVSFILCHIFAFVAVCLVLWWIHFEALGGGGLSWKYGESGKIFNWHPVLMVTTFVFMTIASVIYRSQVAPTLLSTSTTSSSLSSSSSNSHGQVHLLHKWIHGLSWTIALICGWIGVVAVFRSHNDPISGYIANLYSFHSWMGCLVIFFYLIQFIVGMRYFACSCGMDNNHVTNGRRRCSNQLRMMLDKANVMTVHKLCGACIYYFTAITIVLGIMEKEGFIGCGYKVTEADVVPFAHSDEIPNVCKVSHSLGIVIVFMTAFTAHVLHNFPSTMGSVAVESVVTSSSSQRIV